MINKINYLVKYCSLPCLFFVLILVNPYKTRAAWYELGGSNSLQASGVIYSVCSDKNGNIYCGGSFVNSSGNYFVAKWDKSLNTWSELGGLDALAANARILTVSCDSNGNVYAGGFFTNSFNKMYVAKFNGIAWTELGGLNSLQANNYIQSICIDKYGKIYASGSFVNSSLKRYVAVFNANSWSELGGTNALGANNVIKTLCTDTAGNIFASGYFTNNSSYRYVAKWDQANQTWSELGTGVNALNANGNINSVTTDKFGNVYTTGAFVNSNASYYVAKFNGTNWIELGGTDSLAAKGGIESVVVNKLGDVFTGGYFVNNANHKYVAIYNGNAWTELGGSDQLAANSYINGICLYGNSLYTVGNFSNSSGYKFVAGFDTIPSSPIDTISTPGNCGHHGHGGHGNGGHGNGGHGNGGHGNGGHGNGGHGNGGHGNGGHGNGGGRGRGDGAIANPYEMAIYPNPTSDYVTINLTGESNLEGEFYIQIENKNGNVIVERTITGANFSIPLSRYAEKGFYTIKLLDASKNVVAVKKLILQ